MNLRSEDAVRIARIATINNLAFTVIFGILAAIFDKWWMVFFVLLFYRSFSIKQKGDMNEY